MKKDDEAALKLNITQFAFCIVHLVPIFCALVGQNSTQLQR